MLIIIQSLQKDLIVQVIMICGCFFLLFCCFIIILLFFASFCFFFVFNFALQDCMNCFNCLNIYRYPEYGQLDLNNHKNDEMVLRCPVRH